MLGALRRFLPEFLETAPALSPQQRRAIWAITHCRTPALGGRAFACDACGHVHFAYHSCNHKACPQCGAQATARWVAANWHKLIDAPYFLVTFTLPAELRGCFFGPHAKQAYDLFFTAVSGALSEKLAADKGLRAAINGFTAVLHTWTQRLEFHPHIHCLVPGRRSRTRAASSCASRTPSSWSTCLTCKAAFRQHLYRLLQRARLAGRSGRLAQRLGRAYPTRRRGRAALKYLGTYVARTAITDARIVAVDEHSRHLPLERPRPRNRTENPTLPGVEFVRRYLRHVLPRGLRSIRYYGFCHPTAKANRLRVQCHTGSAGATGRPNPHRPGADSVPIRSALSALRPAHALDRLGRLLLTQAGAARSAAPVQSRPPIAA